MTPDISSLLSHHARYRGDQVAFVFAGREYTFAQLNHEVNRLANALLDNGLRKGDKVATVLPNSFELMAAYWAAAVSGLVIVPSSTLLQESGLRTLLNDSDSRMVIAHPSQVAALRAVRDELGNIGDGRLVVTETDSVPEGFRSYADLVKDASTARPDVEVCGEDVYNIMYSSGTTGAPKGIVHTHYIRSMYCTLFANAWRMTPESVALHAGAIVFNGAMLDLMPWMFLGCRYILHEAFDAERFIEDIERHRVTHVVLVPAQIIAILNSPTFSAKKLQSLEMIHNVGAPLHLNHKQQINELLPDRFYELYGVTEGFMTILDRNDAVRKAGSVGIPGAFTEIRIVDENGNERGANEVGEICGRGPMITTGYYGQPELTAAAIRDGWMHSGDLGYLDEDGFLYLVDRKKDMIISGGVNVYPKDIEEIVITHPAVNEVAVFGVEDDRWGEVPVAAVTASAEIEESELVAWVNQRVDAKFQRLSAALVLEEFPRNVAGKILKRELRDRFGRKN